MLIQETIDRGQLRLVHIIRREVKHTLAVDQRRRVNYVLAEYVGADGRIYRKGFKAYGVPEVPVSGTHTELSKLNIQF